MTPGFARIIIFTVLPAEERRAVQAGQILAAAYLPWQQDDSQVVLDSLWKAFAPPSMELGVDLSREAGALTGRPE
jgi:hypothetical protein